MGAAKLLGRVFKLGVLLCCLAFVGFCGFVTTSQTRRASESATARLVPTPSG